MYLDYNDCVRLNKKLYESGIYVDEITNDPDVIVDQYREAGVDTSTYDPSDLVEAFSYYIDYSYERKSEEYNSSLNYDDDYNDDDNDDDSYLYDDFSIETANDDEENDYERWKPTNEGRYYKTDFTEDQECYLKALFDWPVILYNYLSEKGVYKEFTLVDDSNKESDEIIIIAKKVYSINYFFLDQKLISKKEGSKSEYSYAMWCYLERRFERDLPYFDKKEWSSYLIDSLKKDETFAEFFNFSEFKEWSLKIQIAAS